MITKEELKKIVEQNNKLYGNSSFIFKDITYVTCNCHGCLCENCINTFHENIRKKFSNCFNCCGTNRRAIPLTEIFGREK